MRLTSLLMVCLCFGVLSCSKQEADHSIVATESAVEQRRGLVQETGEPDIQVDTESYDFGTIFQMGSYEHVFKLRNAGTAKLVVDRVRSTCGCTATLLSEKEIEPGGEARLEVSLKSGMYERLIAKKITVFSNDPDEPEKKLRITATVVPRLALKPKSLYFKEVDKDEGATMWLTAKPAGHEEVRSIKVDCRLKKFSVIVHK